MSELFVVDISKSPSTTTASSNLNEPKAPASGRGRKMVDQRGPEAGASGSRTKTTMLVVAFTVALATGTAFGRSQTGSVGSPAAEITATASKSSIQVAEPFTLEVTVTAPVRTQVSFPAVGEQLGDFDVIGHRDRFDIPSASFADRRVWTRILTLESIITGDLEIPSVEVRVAGETDSRTLRSDSIPVNVASVLEGRADPTQFRDIRSVVDVNVPDSRTSSTLWWIVAGAGGFTVLAAAAILYVTKRKKWLTPKDWAQQQLQAVASSPDIATSGSAEVLQTVSSILREFIEMQFEVSAPVQTTHEFLQAVKASGCVSPDLMQRFGEFFAMADQAKFAGLQLSGADLDKAVNRALQLVDDSAAKAASSPDTGREAA